MKRYILTEIPRNNLNAGYKAKCDIRSVLISEGFEAIDIKESFKFDKIPEFFKLLNRLKKIENNSEIVFQHPVYSFFNSKFMPSILKTVKRKGLKMIVVIHDLECVRFRRDESFKALETEILKTASAVISHNSDMSESLVDLGIEKERLVNLEIFDYLCKKDEGDTAPINTVCVAGNLDPEKSGYIYKMSQDVNIKVNVYGGNFDENLGKEVNYCGSFSPNELPKKLVGAFGIVWDGGEIEKCSGVTGEYLKINNPHKTSLYLAAGLPVVIWDKAALSKFILKEGAGIALESLGQLPSKIAALSAEDYLEMKNNANRLSKAIQSGDFIKGAVKKAEEKL